MPRRLVPACWRSLILVAACSTEPSPNVLVGTWGGQTVGLTATPLQVRMDFECGARGLVRGPLHVDEQGRFHVRVRATQLYGGFLVEVSGQVQGSDLSVTVTRAFEGGGEVTAQDTLRSGIAPDFGPGAVGRSLSSKGYQSGPPSCERTIAEQGA